MSNCQYCGKPAGVFRKKHAECEQEHQERLRARDAGRQQIAAEILRSLTSSEDFEDLDRRLERIENDSAVSRADRRPLLLQGWEASVERFLDDGVLQPAEETRLALFQERFGLSRDELDSNGALTKVVKAGVLRDILGGKVPQRVLLDGQLPINFQKTEQLVWAFAGAKYLEDKARREFVGGSQGVSVRVMKGVYYRVGAFKGHSVEHTERVHLDTGWVAVTDRNLYFSGARKSVRIPYTKIVSFEPYSDGIGVMRDAASAKPQIFVTGDGWFTYNLVTNLARL